MVTPFENCSTYFLAELNSQHSLFWAVAANSLETVEMVQIRHGREELVSSAHLESNNDPPFPTLFNLKHLDNRSTPPFDLIHDFLVNVDSVVRGLVEESSVGNTSDIRQSVGVLDGSGGWKDTSSDKVASELLGDGG